MPWHSPRRAPGQKFHLGPTPRCCAQPVYKLCTDNPQARARGQRSSHVMDLRQGRILCLKGTRYPPLLKRSGPSANRYQPRTRREPLEERRTHDHRPSTSRGARAVRSLLIGEFGRFFNDSERPPPRTPRLRGCRRSTCVRKRTRFVVQVDLPGVESKDIEITAEKGVLTIKGERNSNVEERPRRAMKRVERVAGSFLRRFTLPRLRRPRPSPPSRPTACSK